MNAGVGELRDRLRRHLAEDCAGRTFTVTDHGRPIARILPVERPTKLEQVRAEGREQLDGEGVVAAAGDRRLLSAWAELGMDTFDPNAMPGPVADEISGGDMQ